MSLAARNTAKLPSASSPRLQAIKEQKATPDDMLGNAFVQAIEAKVESIVTQMIPNIIENLVKSGYRPPIPSQAYIAESVLREALGTRKGSPMAPATFAKQFAGRFVRVPDDIAGDAKTKYVYFKDVEKHFPNIADKLCKHFIQPPYLRKK